MKANQPKRNVFNDAIDLLTGTEPEGGVQMLPIDAIAPFHEHPFKLYEGERLNDMVDSIREHGVLSPVIVQKKASGYEMLAGHNRQNAAKLAGSRKSFINIMSVTNIIHIVEAVLWVVRFVKSDPMMHFSLTVESLSRKGVK